MQAKTFLYILGWVILSSWLLHFLAIYLIDSDRKIYTIKKIVEGIMFIVLVTPVYFGGVMMYYKFIDSRN
ncbi:hypothetical protein [Bacillus sp. RAR_GA_16]|uniref:hypothetical protein n=1 Tax=Bacillus sp. RAR_GA_16 TaxID=2876774 RepID=UPI001CCE9AF9|nr:hypothetical protein [Bacillus sp. RAR_GA_16]MCA0172605.1 hypothetical protein [Bacillus sp. RAR_GA_16]